MHFMSLNLLKSPMQFQCITNAILLYGGKLPGNLVLVSLFGQSRELHRSCDDGGAQLPWVVSTASSEMLDVRAECMWKSE